MTRLTRFACIAVLIATGLISVGCGGFRESQSTFMLETNAAKYYHVRGSWARNPGTDASTIKRVDKMFGMTSYGEVAAARIDHETALRSAR